MKILLLDHNRLNMEKLTAMLKNNIAGISVFGYNTPFAFVTGIYDEMKGAADLALIHIRDDMDENLKMARDVQNYFPHLKLVFYSENTISAESIFVAVPSFFFKIPANRDIIVRACKRIMGEIMLDNNNSLKIISKGQIIKLRYETINYMESAGRKICIYSSEGYYETASGMDEMMSELPEYFYKCHRSYIINIKKVTAYGQAGVSILDKDIIPVSRNLKSELKARIGNI